MKKLRLIKDECCENEIREEDIVIDLDFIIQIMVKRASGEFKNRAIYLDQSYDYVVGIDSEGYKILVPLKKDRCCK